MRRIFFVGIKGVGLAGLAILSKQAGFQVAGSDTQEEFITDTFLHSEGIQIFEGFETRVIDQFFDTNAHEGLVITTAAHGGFDNPQVEYAKKRGIKILNYGQALGNFMNGEISPKKQKGISVSGSHGKTTISALIASCLTLLDFDPSYVVGTGEIFPIGPAGHYGSGDFFIAEADEYFSEVRYDRKPKFLYQKPDFVIINNIDFDHPDVFDSIKDVEQSFLTFIQSLDKDSWLIVNGDDDHVMNVLKQLNTNFHIITFGTSDTNDYSFSQFQQSGLSSTFSVTSQSVEVGEFSLSIPGYHNAKNSLPVIVLLMQLGISVSKIQEVLPKFLGTKRRFEYVGKTKNGMTVIDDYAHHPAEIQATLLAAKEAFPDKKIVSIFQPHTFSRTKALLSEFIASLSIADYVLFLPTFASAREAVIEGEDDRIKEEFVKLNDEVVFLQKSDVVKYVNSHFNSERFAVITMGAGDVYKLANSFFATSE